MSDDKAEQQEKFLEKLVMGQYKIDQAKASKMIADSREYVRKNTLTPEQFIKNVFSEPKMRVVGLGESHIESGRLRTKELVEAGIKAGASVLFLEQGTHKQELIDQYVKEGNIAVLPPALQILEEHTGVLTLAREKQIKLVAVDSATNRDQVMGNNMADYMKDHPKAKGMLIVGQRHLAKFPNPNNNPNYLSVKEHFEKEFPGGMVTMARAEHDMERDNFSILFRNVQGITPTKGLAIAEIPEFEGTAVPARLNSYDFILSTPKASKEKQKKIEKQVHEIPFPDYLIPIETDGPDGVIGGTPGKGKSKPRRGAV